MCNVLHSFIRYVCISDCAFTVVLMQIQWHTTVYVSTDYKSPLSAGILNLHPVMRMRIKMASESPRPQSVNVHAEI